MAVIAGVLALVAAAAWLVLRQIFRWGEPQPTGDLPPPDEPPD